MIEKVNIKDVKPNDDNPRKINKTQLKKLKKSIQDFPEMLKLRPIIVDNDMKVLGGNMRLKALKQLKHDEVYIINSELVDEAKKKEFIIKDNLSYGDWDWLSLQDGWDTRVLDDWGLDMPFEVEEKKVKEDNYEIPEEVKTDIKVGDYFEIGNHKLMCGDSTNQAHLECLMNGQKAEFVFTDPPWNVNYGAFDNGNNAMGYKRRTILNDHMSTNDFKNFMLSAFKSMANFSVPGCPTYVVMSAQEWGNMMLAMDQNDYHWSSTIIWNKDRLVLSRKDYHTKYEPIWYGWLSGSARLCELKDRKQSDVWDFQRPHASDLHPTTKPIELVAHAIKNSSNVKSRVLDLFLGSGSTMVASHQTDRICYGMELDPKYCAVIIDRMIQLKNYCEKEWKSI